jgi:hypothetical protein
VVGPPALLGGVIYVVGSPSKAGGNLRSAATRLKEKKKGYKEHYIKNIFFSCTSDLKIIVQQSLKYLNINQTK